jgi:hypothetical protein
MSYQQIQLGATAHGPFFLIPGATARIRETPEEILKAAKD